MSSMFSLIDLLIVGCGVYVLYVYYCLKFKGEIKEALLLPKGISAGRCKDKEGYIREMSNKVLIFGIVVLACGILCIMEDEYRMLGRFYLLVMLVFAVTTVWFAVQGKKAVKKYWE